MDIEFLVRLVTVCALLIGIANTALLWWWRGSDQSTSRIKEIEGEQDALKERVGAIEGELRHLPSKDEVHQLNLKITEIIGKVSTVENESGSIARTVRRIEDHLLGEKK